MLFTRLQVLTQDQYAMSLTSAWSRCELFAKMCVCMLDTCDPIICGLLVHSLVAVRLLPLGMLQPQCVEFMDWEMLFAASQPEGTGAALPFMLALDCVTVLVQPGYCKYRERYQDHCPQQCASTPNPWQN